jgi:hypothetical protein
MRSTAGALLLLGGFLSAASQARSEDAPPELRIEAEEQHDGLGPGGKVILTVAPDGAVEAVWMGPRPGDSREVVKLWLPAEEMARGREAVTASKFFESWNPSPPVDDGSTWNVWVRLGDRELRRPRIREAPEFEPLRLYLGRFSHQASVTAGLRRGDYRAAASLPYDSSRVASLSPIVDELVACAARQTTPTRSAEAADLILSLSNSEDLPRVARALLERIEGDRRGAVLATWADRLRGPAHAGRRAVMAPIFLGEAETSAPRWSSLTKQERLGFEAALRGLLLDGESRAFELVERMARANGEPDKPFLPPGLVETGEAAVPIVVRLMDAKELQARANAVKTAGVQIGVLRLHFGLREPLSDAVRAALERGVRDDVVPALERRLRDASESYAVRATCVTLLDRWDGRCKAARARALEREEESRAREIAAREAASLGPPPPGPLAIAGRLLDPFDVPLPGFALLAVRADGRVAARAVTAEDGAFRIEGLAEGAYDLFEVRPGEGGTPLPGADRAAEGIAAGGESVVVRLPGSMIRGRVLDGAGAPLPRFTVIAKPQDSPNDWPQMWSHRAETDAAGRFWLLRVPPGAYDLSTNDSGRSSLRGGVGIEPGPMERAIEAHPGVAVTGSLVDEGGSAVSGASVRLFDPGPAWHSWRNATTSADGSFRLEGVDPLREHRLVAEVTGTGGAVRGAVLEGVRGGGQGLVLRLGDATRLRFQAPVEPPRQCESDVRVVRIAGGPTIWHRLPSSPVDWPAAPAGTWRVLVRARDLDPEGVPRCAWVPAGTATTGEAEKTLSLPR